MTPRRTRTLCSWWSSFCLVFFSVDLGWHPEGPGLYVHGGVHSVLCFSVLIWDDTQKDQDPMFMVEFILSCIFQCWSGMTPRRTRTLCSWWSSFCLVFFSVDLGWHPEGPGLYVHGGVHSVLYFSVLIWDDTQKDQDSMFMVEFILSCIFQCWSGMTPRRTRTLCSWWSSFCLVFFSVDLGWHPEGPGLYVHGGVHSVLYFSVLIWDDTQKDQDSMFMVEFILSCVFQCWSGMTPRRTRTLCSWWSSFCLVFFSVDLGWHPEGPGLYVHGGVHSVLYFSVLIWDDTQKDQDSMFMVEFILSCIFQCWSGMTPRRTRTLCSWWSSFCLVFFSVDLGWHPEGPGLYVHGGVHSVLYFSVLIWDDTQRDQDSKFVLEFTFAQPVVAVRLRMDKWVEIPHIEARWLTEQECIPVGCVPPAHWPYRSICWGACPLPHTPPWHAHAPCHARPPYPLSCMTPLDRQTPVKT